MAVSIAVNWTPPASSPLFEDDDNVGGSNASEPQVTPTPTASASSPPTNGNGRSLTTPGISIPRAPSPQAAAPRSYAAAAAAAPSSSSSSSQPSTSPTSPPSSKRQEPAQHTMLPQLPPTAFQQSPPFPHAQTRAGGFGHYPHQQPPQPPLHHAGIGPAYNNSTFARGGNQHFKGGPIPTAAAAAQRPAPLTYNDTFQQSAPGVTYAMASRGNLPPGAMAPSPPPAAGGANGFHPHPYRRGTAPTAAPVTSAPMSVAGSSSSSSSAAPAPAPPSGGMTASPSTSQLAPRVAPRSTPMRQSSSDSARAPRTESTRSTSSGIVTPAEDGSAPHSRSGSVSSQSSAYSSAMSDKASTIGRSTPTASALQAAKKPSPLSRAAAPRQDEDDDDDTNADYGGSDREDQPPANGRTTPAAETKKKGFGGKLRKALSLSTMNEMQQAEGRASNTLPARPTAAPSGRALPSRAASGFDGGEFGGGIGASPGGIGAGSSAASISSRRSTRPPISGSTDGSGKRSLFNRKFNSSTDNISISSTVSSASVMLRKVGNLGKMARRHSLMGLTNMFNKDKEAGKEGLHNDDFGALPVPADETAMAKAGAKKTSRKSDPALASVSHATAELDHGADSSLSPAAHYVRQHQLQMKQQAEAEAARKRQEAEAAAAAAAAAAPKPVAKGKTTDDVVESRQKMIEKEKERLKSKRGWKNRLRGGGSSSSSNGGSAGVNASPTGLETIPYSADVEEHEYEAPQGVYAGGYTGVPPPNDSGSYGGVPGFEGGVPGFDADELEPPPRIGAGVAGEESGDDGETDSLRHWGEGIERSRASAARVTSPKSILKKSASYSRLDQQMANDFARPFAGRVRSNSYDVPQTSQPGAPMLSSMSTTTAGVDRMDGVARPDDNAARPPTQAAPAPSPPVYGHHSNSSMPTLSLMTNPSTSTSTRPSLQKKRINFTEMPIYHSTWPAHVYDRRGELATCNRLTQELAAQIKEELNSFKMEEMVVAPSSRIFTHFFV